LAFISLLFSFSIGCGLLMAGRDGLCGGLQVTPQWEGYNLFPAKVRTPEIQIT
jgi:hypothetical protein